ncbi:MAG TPA: nuclear transport factor 2 family protein [Steroidobacteraceae bacterium]|nr:nuclear transport factor 2 family protein [Steroidobacteraceae bacterium]
MMRTLTLTLAAVLLLSGAAHAQNVDKELDALTARVEKLEATRAIRKLQRAFGYYMDRGLWGDAADLFTDDGTFEMGLDGTYAGKARIREYLKRLHGNQEGLIYGQLNEWITLQPAIFVSADGRSATARWRDHGMLGQYKKHAEWRDGIYENTYVKEQGVWKLKSLRLYVNFVAPYEKGWARLKPGDGLVRSQVSVEFPPDRPPTSTYAAFPEVHVAPFQAANPVRGQTTRTTAPQVGGRLAPWAERIARLEDHDAVENLQAMFGFYFDKGLWGEAASLFARNGAFEYGQSGVYVGQDRIRKAMLLFGPEGLGSGRLNNHMMLQPVITVAADGRTAKGRFQGPVQLSEPGQNGIWGVGIYENDYVKEGGIWKLAKLHFMPTAFTDYDRGWARSLLPMKGPSALFPPDRPPSVVYRTLPGQYLPPFSYPHPVTGAPLDRLPQAADSVTGVVR